MTIPPSDTKFVAIKKILNYMANKPTDIIGNPQDYNEHVSVPRSESAGDLDLWNKNPYSDFDYRHTWMQKLWEGLGFRSKYDEYKENMALQSRETDFALAQQAHQEEYDSALAQAQRERAAGINPDLAGNVDAGSSSGLMDDLNPPISPGHDEPSFLLNVASSLIGGVETLFGLCSTGFDIVRQAQDIRGKSLENDKMYMDNALNAFLSASLSDFPNSGHNSDGSNYIWRFGFDKDSRLGRLFGSSRSAKKYYKAVNLYRESLLGQEHEYAHRASRASNRRLFSGIKSRMDYSEFSDVLDAFEGCISDILLDVEMTEAQRNTIKNVYEAEMTDAMDPSVMADAAMQSAQNEASLTGAEAQKTTEETSLIKARNEAKNSLDSLSKTLDGMGDTLPVQFGKILVDLIKVRVFQL